MRFYLFDGVGRAMSMFVCARVCRHVINMCVGRSQVGHRALIFKWLGAILLVL